MTSPSRVSPVSRSIGQIARFPLQSVGLAALAGLTVARLVLLLPWPLSSLLNLAVAVGMYAYASEVLRQSADGNFEAPEISLAGESEGRVMVAVQIGFVLLILAASLLLGPGGGGLVAVVLAVAMPGVTMSLAMDGDVVHALNPATWLGIAGRIGAPYALLVALTFVLGIAQVAARAVMAYLPPVLDILVYYAIVTYCVLVSFHAMGVLIYRFRDALGHVIEAPVRRRAPSNDPDQRLVDDAEQLVEDGNPAAAESLLSAEIARLGGTPASHALYRKLLIQRGDSATAEKCAPEYLAQLMAQERSKEALALVRDCLAANSSFVLPRPEFVAPLARLAVASHQSQLALSLLTGFSDRYPDHADTAANLLLTARLLVDKLGQLEQASALLDAHRGLFESNALRADFDALRATLAQLQSAQATAGMG